MNWPVLERHRRAAAAAIPRRKSFNVELWATRPDWPVGTVYPRIAQAIANTEGEERVRQISMVTCYLAVRVLARLACCSESEAAEWLHEPGDKPYDVRALVLKGWK